MVAAAVLALLGACSLPWVVGGPGERVGEQVGSWSQANTDSWVDGIAPIAPVLLASQEQVEEWVAAHEGAAEAGVLEVLQAVDLSENVLVVGGYPRCQETSAVILVSETEVAFTVISGDEQIACAWSPYTVDAWAVPLEQTDGEVPTLLTAEDG
ncbi:hypothetical protein GCM10027067_37700 [Pseudactinotalea suaedae]